MLRIAIAPGNSGGGPYFSMFESDESVFSSTEVEELARFLIADYPDEARCLIERKRGGRCQHMKIELAENISPSLTKELLNYLEEFFIEENSEMLTASQDEY